MSQKRSILSRRNFLLTMSAAGVASAAAVVATNKAQQQSTGHQGKRATAGYRASEHVNNYYRTTKV